jgi:mycofactocin precursor
MPNAQTVQAPSTIVLEDQPASAANTAETSEFEALVEADLLVEDISIDGMCGVY